MQSAKKGQGDAAYLLPGTFTTVYQSNRITTGSFQGFGLLHTRIFIAIVKSLQEAIRAEMNGLNWEQMNLFEEIIKDSIQIKLSLKEITSPNHYEDAIKAAKELMGLVIKLKKPHLPKEYVSFRTLFMGVDQPVKLNGKTVLIIHILKAVARELIFLDKNSSGDCINFSKYLYENAISASSKYTIRLYILISSWKVKGGFYISLEDLRKILDLKENEYKNFYSFKQRILLPAQKELQKQGDCWFNTSQENFERKNGKKTIGLNFKVITRASEEKDKLKEEHLKQLLITHGGLNNIDLKKLNLVFKQSNKIDDIIVKTIYLIRKNTDGFEQPIKNKAAFIIKSLLSEFV